MEKCVKINAKDNVAVALCDLNKGEEYLGVTLAENIPCGHKFALENICNGSDVIKYGNPIGFARQNIAAGQHVHCHNLATHLAERFDYVYKPQSEKNTSFAENLNVNVFVRCDGKVGIRNELWVLPLVGCVNGQARQIAAEFKARHSDLHGIDGVFAFTHPYGCSQVGEDHVRTRTLLQRLATHPNAGGVLVLGLGCENNTMQQFVDTIGDYDKNRVKFLVAQDVDDEIKVGVDLLEQLYAVARNDVRTQADLSCLKIGLKCGGSDGLSGITANPLVGLVADKIAQCGGTVIMTEVPEMFGAEQLLMNRAADKQVYEKIVKLICNFKQYYADNNQPCYENPSPGNKAGGITTLEDKSLGCTQKSGSTSVNDVLFDGQRATVDGLNLLNGPGNDMVAVTNLATAGCQLVLFTTGRGTPFGGIVPTVKISTNSALAQKKRNWIDFDAGKIVDGASFEQTADELLRFVVETVNGKHTANERSNSRDIAIFKTGVTL